MIMLPAETRGGGSQKKRPSLALKQAGTG